MGRRLLVPLLVTGLQVVAAALALGAPDLAQAAGFMTGGVPTQGGAIAVLQVVLWAVALAAFGTSLNAGMRRAAHVAQQRRARHLWGGAVLLAGTCVLLAGAMHHWSVLPATMTGGSLQEATQQLAR
jgi:hypothetical protein